LRSNQLSYPAKKIAAANIERLMTSQNSIY